MEDDNIWQWDTVFNCFRPQRFCPHCSEKLDDLQVSQAKIALCPHCLNSFEWRILTHESGAEIPWPHRPGHAYCTLTGERIWQRSPFDWTEYGGGPTRTHSVLDVEQQLFGQPKRFFQWNLQSKWHLDFIHPALDKANHQICALNILRGELYVSFQNGYLARYSNIMNRTAESLRDTVTMYHSSNHLIDIEPETYNYPAFVGDYALVVGVQESRGCALLRFLDQPAQAPPIEIRVRAPGPNVKFWGPALTFGEGDFGFVLVEARMLSDRFEPCGLQVILPDIEAEGGYRIPDWAQHPLFEAHLPRLRQPPIYVRDSNPAASVIVFLLDRMDMLCVQPSSGHVFYVQSSHLETAGLIPTPCFTVYSSGSTHVLYSCIEIENELRYVFSEPWSTSDRLIQWRLVNMSIENTVKTGIGTLGVNTGAKLAADQAWAHLYGNKLSYQNVYMSSDSSRHMVLCGAGVIFIQDGHLTIRNDNHGWRLYDSALANNRVLLNPQGPNALGSIAMCGRVIFVSTGVGLHCVELVGEGGSL